jgi:hypothetical protein
LPDTLFLLVYSALLVHLCIGIGIAAGVTIVYLPGNEGIPPEDEPGLWHHQDNNVIGVHNHVNLEVRVLGTVVHCEGENIHDDGSCFSFFVVI